MSDELDPDGLKVRREVLGDEHVDRKTRSAVTLAIAQKTLEEEGVVEPPKPTP